MARWVEFAGGVLAALVWVTFAASMVALGATSWEEPSWGAAPWELAVAGLSGLGAGVGAYRHSVRGTWPWLALVWASLLGLAITIFPSIRLIGIGPARTFLLPGVLAALVAAGVGTWRSARGGSVAT